MIEKIKKLIDKVGAQLINSIRRFPETIAIVAAMVFFGVLMNHTRYDARETLGNILLVLGLGSILSINLLLLIERRYPINKLRLLLDGIIGLGLIGFYFLLPDPITQKFMVSYISILILLSLLFTLVPYFYKRRYYAVYCLNLFISFLVTYLYTFVLYLGIIAIIFTIDKLFNININNKIYFDIFIITTGLFGVTYFLSKIPKYDRQLTLEDYPKVFKVLFISIVMPLLTAYTLILYAYFAKMLIDGQWPKSILGNLILWYGWISMIILFCIYELGEKPSWPRSFKTIFPIAFIIPLGMLFTTIWIRTRQYGLTIPRYYVWLSSIWFLVMVIYLIQRKWRHTSFVILSLVALLFVSAFGPITGYQMSIRSQNNRFTQLLLSNNMLDGEKILPNPSLPREQQQEISQVISYMNNIGVLDRLLYVPRDFEMNKTKDVFGFENNYEPWLNKNYYFNYHASTQNTITNTAGYDYVVDFLLYQDTVVIEEGDLKVELSLAQDKFIVIHQGEELLKVSIKEIANEIHQKHMHEEVRDKEELSQTFDTQSGRIVLELRHINGIVEEEIKVESIEGRIWVDVLK